MSRHSWLRRLSVFGTTATMIGFGLTGIASAQTITNTGPHSTNRIDNTFTNKCTVENDNNVDVKNSNNQKATTGDATVGGSGGYDGHDWSGFGPSFLPASSAGDTGGDGLGLGSTDGSQPSLDPSSLQTSDPAFGSLLGSTPSFFGSNNDGYHDPSGGNTNGGDAETGNATNSNSTDLSIHIDNSTNNPCIRNFKVRKPGAPVRVSQSNAFTKAAVKVAPGAPGAGHGAGGFGAAVTPAAAKQVSPSVSTVAAVTPSSAHAPVTSTSQKSVISNTGPESTNKISTTVNNKTTVSNNNNVCVTNTNTQQASSGNASVSGNTNAGDSGTGNAGNGNSTGVGASLSN